MNSINPLLAGAMLVLIMSFGLGLVLGGPSMANKVLNWELKQLAKFGRWILKHMFQTIANIFQALAKACGPKKKTKTP